jgi:hypothetical protein
VAKNARDSKRRYFLQYHQNLISYLDETAQKVVDDDDVLIYRLDHPQ